jgi:hypothetical protein
MANAAITCAPCQTPSLKAASMTAEYSKPQGNKAQTKPNTKGAAKWARAAWR